MNLMDMLAGNAPAMYQNDSDMPSLLDNPIPTTSSGFTYEEPQANDAVYHIPAALTKIQVELSEIILQLLGSVLTAGVQQKRLRASINSLLDNDDQNGSLSETNGWSEKVHLLYEQLKTVSKHPSLLVDHFIPKKMLLLESNERLVNLSGKFQLLNRIINAFIDRYPREKTTQQNDFHILIVAESVKELELIESLIIGKKLFYKNLSSRKLYGDNTDLPTQETKVEEPSEDSNSDSRSRRRRHTRKKRVGPQKDPHLYLYLVTSQQLCSNYTPSSNSSNSEFDMIISFDSTLDTKNPSVELIRSKKELHVQSLKTPILVPVPVYSLDHIALEIPAPTSSFFNRHDTSVVDWYYKVLNAFAVNRHCLFELDTREFYIENYGSNMDKVYQWVFNWGTQPFPLRDIMSKFSLNLSFSDEKLIRKLETCYVDKINIQPGTNYKYDEYKRKFAELLNERVFRMDADTVSKLDGLIATRTNETERQIRLDQQEEDIAEQFRKLRKLNDTANITDKKYNRVDGEFLRVEAVKKELIEKKAYLLEITTKDSGVEKLVEEQTRDIKELDDELNTLELELEKLSKDSEQVRGKYQTSSSEAVSLSATLATVKEQNSKLESKLNGIGIKVLPSLIRKDELASYETVLSKLTTENRFISEFFREKLDKHIKERTTILDNSSSGSSSRPTSRISRGLTPF